MLLYFLLCLIQYYSLSTPSLLRCVLRIYDWLWCQLRILEASKWETTGVGGGGGGEREKPKQRMPSDPRIQVTVACVASVSSRVIARTLEREPKTDFFWLSSQLSRRTRAETLAMQAKVTGATHVGGLGPPQMRAIGISCVSRWTNASQNLIHTCDIKGVIIAPTRATALQKPRPRARTTVG